MNYIPAKNKPILICFFFLLLSKLLIATTYTNRTNDTLTTTSWNPKSIKEFEAVYHFGESESEYDLLIIVETQKIYAQIKWGQWNKKGDRWLIFYRNLSNVSIKGNQFYSDQIKGQFVIYNNKYENNKGLILDKAYNNSSEIGIKSYPIDDYFNGKFTQASKRLLNKEELKRMTNLNLKLMRNEIFARYAYTFKTGGDMEKYFMKQIWYSKQHENVTLFLTDLEKENIKRIQQFEKY
jgi:hypothetical protein